MRCLDSFSSLLYYFNFCFNCILYPININTRTQIYACVCRRIQTFSVSFEKTLILSLYIHKNIFLGFKLRESFSYFLLLQKIILSVLIWQSRRIFHLQNNKTVDQIRRVTQIELNDSLETTGLFNAAYLEGFSIRTTEMFAGSYLQHEDRGYHVTKLIADFFNRKYFNVSFT